MSDIVGRVVIIKAVRAQLGISLTTSKDIVDAAHRGGLGTFTATRPSIERAIADTVPAGRGAEVAELLLRLVPTPSDAANDPVRSENPTDVAQAAIIAWLAAADTDDDTVIPLPDGTTEPRLTVGDLRRSLRSTPHAG